MSSGCALKIGDDLPSELCIREISNVLARYASVCQQVNYEINLIEKIRKNTKFFFPIFIEWNCSYRRTRSMIASVFNFI